MKSVLVTGANGFVGRSTSRALLAAGYEVRCAVRRKPEAGVLPTGAGVTIVDPGSQASWREAIAGVDSVVHLIALTHSGAEHNRENPVAFRDTNVGITSNLLEAIGGSDVRRLVYMSSIKAVAEETAPGMALSETADRRPEDDYGRTKAEAEDLIRDRSGTADFEYTILRPPIVYGRGGAGNMARLARLVRRGIPLPLASIDNARSLIFVDNLADAVVTVLSARKAIDETFHVADSQSPSTPELIRQIAAGMNDRARLFPLPERLLMVTGKLVGRSSEVRKLTRSLEVSTSHIANRTGWRPPVPTPSGIEQAFG